MHAQLMRIDREPTRCPACGATNRESAPFCRECAAPVAAVVRCPHCGTPDGERKTITALFADIEGSVALMENLDTGEVVVRSIQTEDLHTDYTPIGHSTNLAARMEGLAPPGGVLVTDHTYRLTAGYAQFRARGLAPFVGREAEMQQIRRALELTRGGRGQVVAVVGEPGTGKSRLFHEAKRLVEDDGTVLEMCAVAYGRAYPYLPL